MQLTDTTAIVTGGASGLGDATARELAARGARVFALDLPGAVEHAEQVDGVSYLPADVTDADQVAAAVDTAAGAGVPLRVLVNCAGIGPSSRTLGRQGPHDLELFRSMVAVNLVGTFNVCGSRGGDLARWTSRGRWCGAGNAHLQPTREPSRG